jgi:hypothetical protein
MMTSFIGVQRPFQQYDRYNVKPGEQFYWFFTATFNNMLGIMYNMVVLLKVALKTNKTGHQVRHYTSNIVERGIKPQ